MTLDELLALLPDNSTGEIDAADLRTIVTELHGLIAALEGRVAILESGSDNGVVSAPWQYTNAPPPPTGNQVRLDNANAALATQAVLRKIDANGADHAALFGSGQIVGLRIQDFDDSTVYASYDVTGPPVLGVDDATFPITFTAGNGTLPNQKVLIYFLLDLTP